MRFFRFTCHQKPECSFFIKKHQMPFCARCFGIYIGYIAAITLNACGLFMPVSFGLCLMSLMFLDWVGQNLLKGYHSNITRFVTGIMGGIGVVYTLAALILLLF
ncbi:MAG: DUF2085 domain-containing protein [Mycoplasmataceae bacterium]|nr:DUF2085 domain-containing protein [Mycoplasmataceae bacterium]